jgi:hypothetical protein
MTSASASRVTRSRNSLALAIALFAGGIVAVATLHAQQAPNPAPPQAAPPANDAPAAAPVAPVTGQSQTQPANAPPAARGKPAAGQSQEHFEPTEKVRADFDVSFPVDI